MNVKKILMFSRDPGGANIIAPLVPVLEARAYEVLLFGKDFALARYAFFGLTARDIRETVPATNRESIREFLAALSLDLIITGTSEDDLTEKLIWSTAHELGIRTVAILDQWMNYGLRFSEYTGHSPQYDRLGEVAYLPDHILVMDEYARRKMVEAGVDAEKVIVTGHPYFDHLLDIRDHISSAQVAHCRRHFGCDAADILVLFASEPISEVNGEGDTSSHYWGYTERTVFASVLRALEQFRADAAVSLRLVVRPHPKEAITNLYDLIGDGSGRRSWVRVDRKYDPYVLMKAARLVIGMSSMFLIETVILGGRILSVQIGLARDNPFILHTMGLDQSVLREADLMPELTMRLCRDGHQPAFEFRRGALNAITEFVEGVACRS